MPSFKVVTFVPAHLNQLLAAWIVLRACYAGDEHIRCNISATDTDAARLFVHELHPDQPLSLLLHEIGHDTAILPQLGPSDTNDQVTARVEAVLDNRIDNLATVTAADPSIEVRNCPDSLWLTVVDHVDALREKGLVKVAEDFEHVLVQLLQCDLARVTMHDLSFTCPTDLDAIWRWNANLPSPSPVCVHDLVQRVIQQRPDATAIHAHDGQFTYRQLGSLAAVVAQSLLAAGLVPGQCVPLVFAKSKWTPVAILAVMSAGGTCIAFDIHQPKDRLICVVQQVRPPLVLSSANEAELAASIAPASQVMVPELLQDAAQVSTTASSLSMPDVHPDTPLYIVFTSGSTGVPKGVLVSHRNFASAIKHQQASLGITSASRVYDFVSAAFDVAWSNVLHSLTAGACLCIPSEQDRQTNIATSIRELGVNFAHITPSVGRLMLAQAPDLFIDKVAFIGEALLPSDVAAWTPRARVVLNTYGPAETTPVSTLTEIDSVSNEPSIGRAVGCVAWVMGLGGGLAPTGAAGELIIEGPTVGGGYLHDVDKTTASFIRDPAWLLRGSSACPGRSGTLYKTGDNVRLRPDGSLVFVGRRDGQVKINGQRVELGDMESHLHQLPPQLGVRQSTVDVVIPRGSDDKIVTAFVVSDRDNLADMAAQVTAALLRRLPQYMIPRAWVPVQTMPMTSSGKLDRIELRKMASEMSLPQLLSSTNVTDSATQPQSATESILFGIVAQVTNIPVSMISRSSGFMQLGGDSMKAMQLVAAAQSRSLSLSVAEIIQAASLGDLAAGCTQVGDGSSDPRTLNPIRPFARWAGKATRARIARLCGVEDEQVEDAFPCTPLQEGMLALSAQRPRVYRSTNVFELSSHVDMQRLEHAWNLTTSTLPILRTRIVDIGESHLIQAVLRQTPIIQHVQGDLKSLLASADAMLFALGTELQRLYVLSSPAASQQPQQRYLILSLHHSLYDGLSYPMIIQRLEHTYGSCALEPLSDFREFVHHVTQLESAAVGNFWKGHFSGIEAETFPPLPSQGYAPAADDWAEHWIRPFAWPISRFTATTIIRASWALLQDQYTASIGEVLFGNVVTGRQAAIPGVTSMCGPTMATVPLRLELDMRATVAEFLHTVQAAGLESVPYEQVGLQTLKSLSPSCARGTEFQTLLVVQPEKHDRVQASKLFSRTLMDDEENLVTDEQMLARFNPVSLLWQFHMTQNGLRLKASFDSVVLCKAQVLRMASQLEHIIRQICDALQDDLPTLVGDIERVSHQDVTDLWANNRTVPPTISLPMHHVISRTAQVRGSATAIQSWDGSLSYTELDRLSTSMAQRLVDLHVAPGHTVALSFEKSMWTALSALAVMKAGGVSVTIDASLPDGRVKYMLQDSNVRLVLSSRSQHARTCRLAPGLPVVVSEDIYQAVLQEQAPSSVDLPEVDPSQPLFIVYTSGSTGRPKGAITSHANFASAAIYQQQTVGLSQESRVLDVVSYAFDVSWWNMLHTLSVGGCLCIPSEDERAATLNQAVNRLGANLVQITPTMARLMDAKKVSSLQTVILTGEAISASDFAAWSHCTVRNTYGPCECSINATCQTFGPQDQELSCIGRPMGHNAWIADARDYNKLAAVGATGELLLEGPLVGLGYVNDPVKTDAAFVLDPSWLAKGSTAVPGRQGRLYRTGDLVRLREDGSLLFLGRRDGQVKIRGQRIELSEIEATMQRHLKDYTVAAQALVPSGDQAKTIVAFLSRAEFQSMAKDEREHIVRHDVLGLWGKLQDSLPGFMIPSGLVALSELPTTASGKIDRRALVEVGQSLEKESLAKLLPDSQALTGISTPPRSADEAKLQEMMAFIIGATEPRSINLDQTFTRIGGDSLSAMKFVAAARGHGFRFAVAELFKAKSLRSLAQAIEQGTSSALAEPLAVEPFSLLEANQDVASIRRSAAEVCSVALHEVEDIYPPTALQEGLIALSSRYPDKYISRDVMTLHRNVDIARLQKAWTTVELALPILRTRLAHLPDLGLVQVVLQGCVTWSTGSTTEEYLDKDQRDPMLLGKPLMRLALVTNHDGSKAIVWTIHHSLYDIWTMQKILRKVEKAYTADTARPMVPFSHFVRYIKSINSERASSHWSQYLHGVEAESFPRLPSADYEPRPDQSVDLEFGGIHWQNAASTPAILVRAAWGVLIAKYSNSPDAVFGALSSGRQAGVHGIEDVAGPTIATVPIRVHPVGAQTVEELLRQVQNDAVDLIEFEQYGVQNIRKINADTAAASAFQSLVVIQPNVGTGTAPSNLFASIAGLQDDDDGLARGYSSFSVYAILLVVSVQANGLRLRVSYDSTILDEDRVRRTMHQLEHLLQSFTKAENQIRPVQDIPLLSSDDIAQISKWNLISLVPVQNVIHVLVDRMAHTRSSTAIDAWDGILSYADLASKSTALALVLIARGVSPRTYVPLVFEKSRWTSVAMLAVMKAGATAALFDPELPEQRLQQMLAQMPSYQILCSAKQAPLARRLCPGQEPVVLQDALDQPVAGNLVLPSVQPGDAAYCAFTSGSTGAPKGIIITHSNFVSAIGYQRMSTGLGYHERTYDFASYSFDAAWFNTLHTLAGGGTLCVPSNEERKSDLEESIQRFGATSVVLTPSTARLLNPSRLPMLSNLLLVGEAATQKDLDTWSALPGFRVAYGPAESTVMATGVGFYRGIRPGIIGKGVGTTTWIVDAANPSQLAPVGAAGELWLEGPLTGMGYLGDVPGSFFAFEDLPWLDQLQQIFPDRARGRFYRTGDLVRYAEHGYLEFLGRADQQVKLRGQRIELGDVEHHVAGALQDINQDFQVAAEVIQIAEKDTAALVAFLSSAELASLPASQRQEALTERVRQVEQVLSLNLPAYQVPSAYIAMDKLPTSSSGKIDRRALRDYGTTLTRRDLALAHPSALKTFEPVSSSRQLLLRMLWAQVLHLDESSIGASDSFLQLGGDSVSAMRLASLARHKGLALAVADVFIYPRLAAMADHLQETFDTETYSPFSLLGAHEMNSLAGVAAVNCSVARHDIADVLPCTPLQEGMLALTARRDNDYVSCHIMPIRSTISIQAFREGFERLVHKTPILRTRIVELGEHGLCQTIVKPQPLHWEEWESTASFRKRRLIAMGLGTPLQSCGLVRDDGRWHFVWDLHHALYDGFSFPLLLKRFEAAVSGCEMAPALDFPLFVKQAVINVREQAKEYWTRYFEDLDAPSYPPLPAPHYQPRADDKIRISLDSVKWLATGITSSSILRAAWALMIAMITDSEDVVFGAVVSGRQAALAGIDEMSGPTIATVPLRVRVDQSKDTVASFLEAVQTHGAEMVPFEQFGMQNIQKLSQEAQDACRFQSLLVVQPQRSVDADSQVFSSADASADDDDAFFNTYAMMLHCQLQGSRLVIHIDFDSQVVQRPQAQRIASQFVALLRQLNDPQHQHTLLHNIPAVCAEDLRDIWTWNRSVPERINKCVHDIIAETTLAQPDALAIDAWDGQLTYAQLKEHSDRFAQHLIWVHDVRPAEIVPLCFEKSVWMAVAVHGVMKAGAASISMDATQPEERLRTIVGQARPRLVLSSRQNQALAERLGEGKLPVAVPELALAQTLDQPSVVLPRVSPSDKLYIVYTSGSTGVPKGVAMTHASFASASYHQRHKMDIGPGSRVYDFVSYSFDFAWSNALNTLCMGGCLCVPSETERKSNLMQSLQQRDISFVHLTASVVNVLDTAQLPHLRALALGGERMDKSFIRAWDPTKRLLNFYGPAECAQTVSITDFEPCSADPSDIGRSLGVNAWLTKPSNPDQLAMVGAVAELCLEGPMIALGYLDTAAGGLSPLGSDPAWLLAGGGEGVPGRRGRIYRTGDLVRYNDDGSLVFLGRRDQRVKIRGQRVELPEVEHHVRLLLAANAGSGLDVVADLITPRVADGEKSNPTLVAFLSDPSGQRSSSQLLALSAGLDDRLSLLVPTYMVPTAYIPLAAIPLGGTGKVDRKKLRKLGSDMTWEQLAALSPARAAASSRAPTTDAEKDMAQLWATLLRIDVATIRAEDSFFRVGGDSIGAMRLVGWLARRGLQTTVAEVFAHPKLCELVQALRKVDESEEKVAKPTARFALLKKKMGAQRR